MSDNDDLPEEPVRAPSQLGDDSPYRPPQSPLPPPFPPVMAQVAGRPQPTPPWGFVAAIGFVALQVVLGIPVAIVALMIWGMRFMHAPEMQWLTIAAGTTTSVVGSLLLMPVVYGRAAWRRIGLRWPSASDTLLVVVLFVPLAIVVSELTNLLAHFIPHIGMEFMASLGEMPLWLLVIGACVFPAVGEEVFFRGFIGRGMVASWGPMAGVLVTSLLFGAVHMVPLQAIGAAVLGIALHYVYLTTKSLAAPILLHFLNNLFATLAMRFRDGLPIPGVSVVDEDLLIATPLDVLLISLTLVGLVAVLFWHGRTQWLASDGQPVPFGYVTGESPADASAVAQPRRLQPVGIVVALAVWGLLLWRLQAAIVGVD